MDAKKVGSSIAFLRKHYGITQSELAERLGVTDKAVSRWERGQGTPDISFLTRLSIILDTDIESILEGNLTQIELQWKGILNLNYFEGIYADTQMFDKRIVYFQLSFLMLAGIQEICIRGENEDIEFARNSLREGTDLGLHLEYETVTKDELSMESTIRRSKMFANYCSNSGVMMIDGLDFLYGKDVTKCFRRIMYDGKYVTRLTNFKKKPTSIYFFPKTEEVRKYRDEPDEHRIHTQVMERGVITFPIKNYDDLLDAAEMLRILERHQGEKVAYLEEISARRTLVPEKNIKQL